MIDLSNEALDALVAELRPLGDRALYEPHKYHVAADAITALRAREAAIVAAAFEVLCNVLYCCDTEAQAIANRISGPRGERNRCPDGVQVLEDAETIIRAAAALVTPSDATAALEAIKRGERNKARRQAAEWHHQEGWKLDEDAVPGAILAMLEPENEE